MIVMCWSGGFDEDGSPVLWVVLPFEHGTDELATRQAFSYCRLWRNRRRERERGSFVTT